MRPEEAVLFLIVTVLSFALVAAVVAPLVRKKRPARQDRAGAASVPPASAHPASPYQASRHEIPARSIAGFVVPGALEGPRCPACRRSLLAGFRFCPFDGTPLLPEATPARAIPAQSGRGGVPRKICPRCARAYQQDTTVCEHDGIPLVPVN
jgi:hypothetical protein